MTTSISDKLTAIYDEKNKIRDAINTKGGTLANNAPLSAYAPAIYDIPTVSPTEPSYKWAYNPSWWDVKTILENHEAPDGYIAVCIYLVRAVGLTQTFATGGTTNWDAYATSDGSFYNAASTIHTWDTSKDKQCDEGYKTRYIIGYLKTDSNKLFDNLIIGSNNNSSNIFTLPQFNAIGIVFNKSIILGTSNSTATIFNSSQNSDGSWRYIYHVKISDPTQREFIDVTSTGKIIIHSLDKIYAPFYNVGNDYIGFKRNLK